MLTRTHIRTCTTVNFAEPHKKCLACGGWAEGALNAPGPLTVIRRRELGGGER